MPSDASTERTLLLLRHAKSSWDEPALDDHDRPLAPRGERAAPLIGGWVRERGPRPQLVLCSSALRARATLELVAGTVDLPDPSIEAELYGASAQHLRDRLRRVPDEVVAVMLVGHNPGLRELAIELAGGGAEARVGKFPTAALAVIRVPAWAALGPGVGRLEDVVKPKDLA